MRFESRLIRPDEPPLSADGNIELPDDLAALAEQLADDAAHLSACYPAGPKEDVTPVVPARVGGRPIGVAVIGGLACASVLAGAIAVGLFLAGSPQALTSGSPKPLAPQGNVPKTLASTPASPDLARPALLSVGDYSGPEREAVLDLLEGGSSGLTTVSF